MLVTCLYASRPHAPPADGMLREILEKSRKNNPPSGVTGLLGYTENVFVQVLEGGRDEVCRLFNTIVSDERHHNVRLLAFNEISERQFGAWMMGQVNVETINPALLIKYSEHPVFDPFAMTGTATMALLRELVDAGAIASRGKN